MGARKTTCRCVALGLALSVAACVADGPVAPVSPDSAQRIVSLDFCADQYLLKLVERERILALSPDATMPFSYMREAARGLPSVRPVAEDALVLKPDLIIRSYGGGPDATRLFERAGIPVVQIGWAGDLDGIRSVTADVGKALGATQAANALIADMDAQMASLKRPEGQVDVLYITPSGTTTGPGSLIDNLISEAGLQNYETAPGWRALPLERMVGAKPDMVAAAFFDDPARSLDMWGVMRHPVAKTALSGRPRMDFDSAWVSCGGWFAMDALVALNRAGRTMVP